MIARLRIGLIVAALFLVTLVLLPAQLVGLFFDLKIRRFIPRLWHRAAAALLGIRIRRHGEIERRRPLMLVCNHVSWLDIVVLGAVADLVFIAKADVADWPIFGLLAKLHSTIFVARDNRRKTGDKVDEIAARMAAGEVVVLFPEGTTSDGNRLLPIKSSLFGAAATAATGVPDGIVHVQPVALAWTRVHGMAMGRYHRPLAAWPGDVALLPHLTAVLKEGALDVEVAFGASLPFSAGGDRKQLAGAAAASMRAMLRQHLRGAIDHAPL